MSVSDEQSTSFAELQGKSASHRKLSLLSDLQTPCPQPTSQDSSSQFVLFDLKMLCEMLQPLQCPHCSETSLRVGATGAMMGYAVEVALACGSCGRELSRIFTSQRMATNSNKSRQPFAVNHYAVLAAKEGGFCQTGLVRMTSLMNIRGSLHHKTFSSISSTIQSKLYGVAADTLSDSHRAVHRVYDEMYGPCEGPRQLAASYDVEDARLPVTNRRWICHRDADGTRPRLRCAV